MGSVSDSYTLVNHGNGTGIMEARKKYHMEKGKKEKKVMEEIKGNDSSFVMVDSVNNPEIRKTMDVNIKEYNDSHMTFIGE